MPDYTVISADGEWLGRVEAPPRHRILDVAHGSCWGSSWTKWMWKRLWCTSWREGIEMAAPVSVAHAARPGLLVVLASLLPIALAGCGDADGPNGSGAIPVQIEDSAGIRIVEYDGVPSRRHSRSPTSPSTRTAPARATTPSRELTRRPACCIRTGARRSQTGETRRSFHWPPGRSSELIARSGEGPGEFGGRTPRLIAGGQDTLLAHDTWNRRVLQYADGSLMSTVRLPGSDDPAVRSCLDWTGRGTC